MFRKHSSCPAALIHKLLDTPKMSEHLASQSWQLNRLGLSLGAMKVKWIYGSIRSSAVRLRQKTRFIGDLITQ
jgi:hypothetical protein